MKSKYFDIIYEDEHLLIINKKSGVLTIPDRFNRAAPSIYRILLSNYGQIFVVHRLDRDTSGIMMFAKDAETHRQLNIDFENNNIRRIYHTLVEGVILREEFEIDIPLRASKKQLGKTIPSAKGKPSLTLIKVLERFRNQTLVECELKTGRHHQIRVHLQSIGHPLLVDDLYGNRTSFLLSYIKSRVNLKKGTYEEPIISRLTMHSRYLEITHPINQQRLKFEAPYQKDFAALIQLLKKYAT